MQFIVTCFLEQDQSCEFIVYGSSEYNAHKTFERTLQSLHPMTGEITLSDGESLPVSQILAYRVDPIKPLF
ncbi:hypothetical protein ACFQO8_01795 [Exiguobacterium aestuarii]|uniref:Uncharacterized protein n=1 Tax=Exiguobacterium aestuarii TaxID=273527 RepID=A0ABW2PH91_9BACL|nr:MULTISPECIES: hypothetical protein [Exiguobacterium]MCT4785107.1 hypothetical protein [Exiguobacterium aestuarii]